MTANKEIPINTKLYPIVDPVNRYNVIYGGRGSGKSWFVADLLVSKCFTEKDIIILCVKGTMRSIKDSVKSVIEGSIHRNGLEEYFYITNDEIICKHTNSKFIFNGLQNPDRLKSIESVMYLWIEEAAVDITEAGLSTMFHTIRRPGSKIFITFNPKLKTDAVYNMFIDQVYEHSTVIKLNYLENPCVSPETISDADALKKRNYLDYMHEFMGELANDDSEALFRHTDIQRLQSDEIAAIHLKGLNNVFEKIVVALDPSGTANENSDACGVIVAGKYMSQQRYAIIEDRTLVARPSDWSRIAVALYKKYNANVLVYEGNFGKLMVEDLIKLQDRFVRFQQVHAKNGKVVRAEPVQSLYEDHKVDHFDGLGELELEMTTFTGSKGQKSPNRLDAMVWAIRYLCGKAGNKMGTGSISLY